MNIRRLCVIYNHQNNTLLLFGGYDCDNDVHCLDYILEFNMKTKQWNKLSVSLPKGMYGMSCTMAMHNKYVLLFGGIDDNSQYSDNIYIYSLKRKTLTKSKLKVNLYPYVTINDKMKDEKVVFGYIRNQW
eukprot:168062_1